MCLTRKGITMKTGYRKPNYKSRVKSRTTGKLKRSVKRASNPLYGKKGMGMIKNPKKAMYNKVYSRTTFRAGGAGKRSSSGSPSEYPGGYSGNYTASPSDVPVKPKTGKVMITLGILCIIGSIGSLQFGGLIFAALLLFFGIRRYKAFKNPSE